jgi:hypothetical protein
MRAFGSERCGSFSGAVDSQATFEFTRQVPDDSGSIQ